MEASELKERLELSEARLAEAITLLTEAQKQNRLWYGETNITPFDEFLSSTTPPPLLAEVERLRALCAENFQGMQEARRANGEIVEGLWSAEAKLAELSAQLAETQKAYETVKAWAHRLEGNLTTVLARCDEHQAGSEDSADFEKFAGELIELSNEISLGNVRSIQAQLQIARGDSKRLERLYLSAEILRKTVCLFNCDGYPYKEEVLAALSEPITAEAIDADISQITDGK